MTTRPCDAPVRVYLQTRGGFDLSAQDDAGGAVLANRHGVGVWEVFTIRNFTRTSCELRGDDRIALASSSGRWVSAAVDGTLRLAPAGSEIGDSMIFTLVSRRGPVVIGHGEEITLRASNGRYLHADGGGGGAVTASGTSAGPAESFRLSYWSTMLIRFRASGGQYVVATNGGGSSVRADRVAASTWETFNLVRLSGRTGPLSSGESIALQVWNGQFVSAAGGGGAGLTADRNRAAEWETFIIGPPGGATIENGRTTSLQTANSNYVTAEDGGGRELVANRIRSGPWEQFTVEFPESSPAPFAGIRSSTNISRPFATPPTPNTTRLKIVVLLVQYAGMPAPPDPALTAATVRAYMTGPTSAIRQWVQRNSFGVQDVDDFGLWGILMLPQSFEAYKTDPRGFDNGRMTDALNAAEVTGLFLPGFDRNRDGVVMQDELVFVMLDFSGCGQIGCGHRAFVDVTTTRGRRYQGLVASEGLYLAGGPVQGIAQLRQTFSTLSHEIGHQIYGLPDRYYGRVPIRGDVVADRTAIGDWEKFTIRKLGGGGIIGHTNRVQLVNRQDMVNRYLTAPDVPPFVVNMETATSASAEFLLERAGGDGDVRGGDVVSFRTSSGKYLVAEFGGGDNVHSNAIIPREWERFTIRLMPGSGTDLLQSDDLVALETANGRYVVAEVGGRTTDPGDLRRGFSTPNLAGNGVGGGYDIMDDNSRNLLLSTYDRIKRGWIPAKVLEPNYRGCYRLQPTSRAAEAIILWDPMFPDEYYVVENRQIQPGIDDVPSTGVIVSWVSESLSYWRRWGADGIMEGEFPAVISNARANNAEALWIPNPRVAGPRVNPRLTFGREANDAAFTNGEVVLPRGDGSLSRFRLSFKSLPGQNMAISIL